MRPKDQDIPLRSTSWSPRSRNCAPAAAPRDHESEEHQRLRALEVELDQCWDLLRQRRALRETGGDPREARVRPAGEVEGYLG